MSDIGVFSMMISQLLELIARQSSLLFFASQQSMDWIMKISRLNGNQALAETLGKQSQGRLRKFLPLALSIEMKKKPFQVSLHPAKTLQGHKAWGFGGFSESHHLFWHMPRFVGDLMT